MRMSATVPANWYCFNAEVDFEIAASFSTLSFLGILFVFLVLCIYSRRERIEWITKRSSQMIFFYVALLSLLATLLYKNDFKKINFAFIIFMLAVSIFVILWGSSQFFRQCTTVAERDSIVREESNLSTFIVIITVIITLLEVLIILGSVLDHNVWNCLLFGAGTIQKTVQVFVYHCKLRGLMARGDRLSGASWYYKTIALVNLVLWNESIEVTNDEQTKYMASVLKGGYNIFAKAYTALIVDYRLICCILFVEHAFTIDNVKSKKNQELKRRRAKDGAKQDLSDTSEEIEQDAKMQITLKVDLKQDLRKHSTEPNDNKDAKNNNNNNSSYNKNIDDKYIVSHISFEECEAFKNSARTSSGAGFVLGLLLIFLQILNGMVYSGNDSIGSWTNTMGCVAMWSFVICGVILARKVGSGKQTDMDNINGVEYLIIAMGFYGTIFWTIKTIASACWTVRAKGCNHWLYNYLFWTTFKNGHYPFLQLVQIFVFLKISNVAVITQQDSFKKVKQVYFLVPFLMMTALAIFGNLILSEYTFYVEKLAKKAEFSTVTEVIYATGSPLALGFSLHMFLHLFIVYNQIRRFKHSVGVACGSSVKIKVDLLLPEHIDDIVEIPSNVIGDTDHLICTK